ncbi:WD repeat and SOF domain-containing protein 1 [Fistulifera solaris]|uniref:DDB1- and CUL4-associated factor 13 n=1 Tax=Fistulifera solaris TaxID=1519565 RepID=A0A1Z5KJ05_FISSO|nr:WD repeat and SOF domain-containing protein 1 [Fistulifera solaris]|eukprot:GAX26115.1 WD repeat and SOF domain-containing protein 1 [Fistulifera solaris]
MKIQTLKRTTLDRECPSDLRRASRNLDPTYHPLQRAREYTRAVTSAKLERMFAHPLIGNLGNGHRDSVTCSSLSRRSLLPLVSGSADGTVAIWDLTSRTQVAEIPAHTRVVTGVVFAVNGETFYSCSDDGFIHQWTLHANSEQQKHNSIATWRIPGSFKSIDHHWMDISFATASDSAVQLWTPERSTPVQTYSELWGSDDTVTTVRFHPVEHHLLAGCSADRGIGLFDTRSGVALQKTILRMRSNDLQWNPMEPMNFVVANEDYNAYTFDMRKLDQPTRIYKGHTSAVMSAAWSPTGREFATGSYDRTIRIFSLQEGAARDIYHTKRMQRVMTVQYTLDHKFIISGSDESNLRLWKARASEKLGQLTTREEAAQQYRSSLVKKYQHLPEIKRIHKARKLPKVIKKQTAQTMIMKESADRKQANRVKYDRKGEHSFVGERKKVVVKKVD